MTKTKVLAYLKNGAYVCVICGEDEIPGKASEWVEHFRLFHPDEYDNYFH